MKKVLHLILILGMFLSSLCFGAGLFCAEAMKKDHLLEAVQRVDMVEIVKSEMGDQYELIGELLDTKEFKSILSTYTDGLIDYIADGSGTIDISREQLRELFTNYSSILLEQYPELAFLPTDKFIDFLTESVNVEKILPSYEEVMAQMPVEALTIIKWMKAPWLVAGSLGVFLICGMIYLAGDIKGALRSIGCVLLMSGGIMLFASGAEGFIFSLSEMQKYVLAKPAVSYIIQLLRPIASAYMAAGLLAMGSSFMIKKGGRAT